MLLEIQMVDTDTGEVLYRKQAVYACQFHKSDSAFKLMHNVCESAVRGIRFKKCASIELKIRFCEPLNCNSPQLPFPPQDVYESTRN